MNDHAFEAKLAKLLEDESIERRIAAAIVIGELGLRSAGTVTALMAALASGIPLLQEPVLAALAKTRTTKAIPRMVETLLETTSAEVRKASKAALVEFGEDVLPTIKAKLSDAAPENRRLLDEVLASLGGKDAFSTLLLGMTSQDAEAAKHAAISMRSHLRGADAKAKRTYLAEAQKFLAKARAQNTEGARNSALGAIKILGLLEDPRASDALLEVVQDKRATSALLQEAFIALRFCMTGNQANKGLVQALVRATESADRTLAQTALLTLASLDISDDAIAKLAPLLHHADASLAQIVFENLGKRADRAAGLVLLGEMPKLDRTRIEWAQAALLKNDAALPEVVRALLATEASDYAWTLRTVIKPKVGSLPPATRKSLVKETLARMGTSERGWEALLDLARDAAPTDVQAGLETLLATLDKSKKEARALSVLQALCRMEKPNPTHRAQLGTRLLRGSALDPRVELRARDEALKSLADALKGGADVSTLLLKDRKLDETHLYYAGFHFSEQRHIPGALELGRDLLSAIVSKNPRTKLAKMAKNKLQTTKQAEE
jgi:hypothetical protein